MFRCSDGASRFSGSWAGSVERAGLSAGLFRLSDSRKPRRAASAERASERSAHDRAARLIARLLADDRVYARKVARVRRYQARLRGRLLPASWRIYLQLEEAELGRWLHALERVAEWAVARRRRPRRR